MNSKTLFYIIKRILLLIIILFFVITGTFFIMHLIPGGPFADLRTNIAVKKILTAKYGLDKPLIIQFFLYLKNILSFNFGESISSKGEPVLKIIISAFKFSAIIGIISAIIAIFFGILIGTISAFKQNKLLDKTIMAIIFIIASTPSIVLVNILNWIFREKLKLFHYNVVTTTNYILAIVALSLPSLCYIVKLTRTSTIDVLNTEFIKALQAKGLSKKTILFKHCLRNSLIPVITYSGTMIAYIITGSIIVETVFCIRGIGCEYIFYIFKFDYPVIMGMTIFFTFIMLIMLLISDILYKIIDPRIDIK